MYKYSFPIVRNKKLFSTLVRNETFDIEGSHDFYESEEEEIIDFFYSRYITKEDKERILGAFEKGNVKDKYVKANLINTTRTLITYKEIIGPFSVEGITKLGTNHWRIEITTKISSLV